MDLHELLRIYGAAYDRLQQRRQLSTVSMHFVLATPVPLRDAPEPLVRPDVAEYLAEWFAQS